MSVLDRPRESTAPPSAPRPAGPGGDAPVRGPSGAPRPGRLLAHHGRDLALLVPLLVLAAVVQGTGLADAPRRGTAEGALVGEAWAVLHGGSVHPTPVAGTPPLAVLQVAGYDALTGALGRASTAVAGARELVLGLGLVAAVLLWVLVRRLRRPRWAAVLAVLLATVSPLALELHRTVSPENLAAPWVVAAVLLVLTPGRRLPMLVTAAACLLVAVLTAETALLVLPPLAWVAWRRYPAGRHRTAVALVATLLGALGTSYLAVSVVGGGDVRGGRAAGLLGGGLLDPGSPTRGTAAHWFDVDPVLVVATLGATVLALALRRVRPLAVGTLVLLAVLAGTGYPAEALGALLLLSAAILVPSVATAVRRHRPTRLFGRDVRRSGGLAAAGGAGVLVGLAATTWAAALPGLLTGAPDRPLVDATAWVARAVPADARLLTDDAAWVELVGRSGAPGVVVPLTAARGASTGSAAGPPFAWVLSTEAVRRDLATRPELGAAVQGATTAASFGAGTGRVDVLRVPGPPEPAAVAPDPPAEDPEQVPVVPDRSGAVAAGQALLANPAVSVSDTATGVLLSGQVDDRVLTLLAVLAADHRLAIDDFPATGSTDGLVHAVRIAAVDGRPLLRGSDALGRLEAVLRAQPPRSRPTTSLDPAGLTVTFAEQTP